MGDCLMEKYLLNTNNMYSCDENGIVYSYKSGTKKELIGGSCSGYKQVCLILDGKQRQLLVHRIVAELFLGKSLEKTQVNHIDGDRTNNKVENLEWVTGSENMKHAVSTKLWTEPTLTQRNINMESAGKVLAKFSIDEASDLLELMDSLNLSASATAKIVGVSKTTVLRLVNGKTRFFREVA